MARQKGTCVRLGPPGRCKHCGRCIFGGKKGMRTHLDKKHRGAGRKKSRRSKSRRSR